MKSKTVFFSIFFLICLPLVAQSATIERVYEVTQPVASQQSDIRNAAFQQGLIEVAVRVSGNSLTPTQLNLNQAGRLVRQYRYQQMEQAEIDAFMKQNNTLVEPKYKLWVQFDDGKIKQLLKDNGLPIWGYQRPNVLVWLAVKDGKNRYLLKQSDNSQIKDAVADEARRRGLPIMWPNYDAADKKQLSFIDVWGQFWEPVKQASKRYGVNAILLGRMNWSRGSWQVDWSLQLEDKTENWQLTALDLKLLMSSGVGVATDHISSRFAVFADNLNDAEFLLRIRNLGSVKQYAAATHYLASLAPVKNIYATDVRKDYIDFHVELSGDENDLKRIIALGKVLLPDNTPLYPVTNPAETNDQEGAPGEASGATATDQSSDQPIEPANIPRPNVLQYRLNG